MMKKTILALSTALVIGSASTALAQFIVVEPEPYGPAYMGPAPYGYSGPYDNAWWTNRRALHQRRAVGDTNGL
jgi:hypothetical protein